MTRSINLETLSKAIAAAEKDIHFYDPPDAELSQALIDAGKAYQSMQWQPIQTAPKDGTVMLAYWPEILSMGKADYSDGTWWTAGMPTTSPSHWMPIPAAPKDTP